MRFRLLLPILLAASVPGHRALAQDPVATDPNFASGAVLGALDKITARVSQIQVAVGDRAEFFRLSIDVLSCQERVVDQRPESAAFLVISETPLDGSPVRVFSGWMFASSPSISAMDHPIYDVWLERCDNGEAETEGE